MIDFFLRTVAEFSQNAHLVATIHMAMLACNALSNDLLYIGCLHNSQHFSLMIINI